MTLFRSTASTTISFDVGDTRYVVPPGAVCDLEKRYAYVPGARGLPIVEVDRKDVKADEAVLEGAPVPPPKRTRERGVASGRAVLESDDGDDRVGEPISEARAALLDIVGASADAEEDESADVGAAVPAVVAKVVRARKGADSAGG